MKNLPKKVTTEDKLRLAPHLSGINRLNESLMLGLFTPEDLAILISLEAQNEHPRKDMIDKLVATLTADFRLEVKRQAAYIMSLK